MAFGPHYYVDGTWSGTLVSSNCTATNYAPNIKERKKEMNLIAKLLLDEPTKKLVKAGILDENLDLSHAGTDVLMAILVEQNKDKLVAKAEEIIAEREAKKK